MSNTHYIHLNGQIIAEDEALISPANRGMMYGDGCFETLRCYAGKFLGFEQHYERLRAGLAYLEIDIPFTEEELIANIKELLKLNRMHEAEVMIRLQCWREGARGYSTNSTHAHWMIQSTHITSEEKELRLILAKTRCIPSEALERKFKLRNGLNYIKAAQEARKCSCDDALMLTVNNEVSETTSANIFWVRNKKLYTPAVVCDLLPGITRSFVIGVSRSLGIDVEEGRYELGEVQKADAVFATNSLMEIAEVISLNDIRYEVNHSLIMKIKIGFQQFKVREIHQ